jgi:hypothetical protein
MALGLSLGGSGDGSFEERVPILKYDSRAGRLFRVDRSNESGQWETDTVEITNDFQAVIDMENVEVGWMNFQAGSAPDFKMVALGEQLPPKPGDAHRQGFRVRMKLGKMCGGDVREIAGNAKVMIAGFDKLHTAYEAGLGQNAGKLPVVKLAKTIPVTTGQKGQQSTNYEPVFEIVKWVDRPEGLTAPNAPEATQAQEPKKEAPKEAPKPAADDGDEF